MARRARRPPLPTPARAALALALTAAVAAASQGCSTVAPGRSSDAVDRAGGAAPARLPAWLGAPAALERAPALEEAAALLCARDTDGVIDDDARHAAHLVDGQVVGLLERAADAAAARAALARAAGPLLVEKRMTHAGVAVGRTPSGQACAALVAVRRLITLNAQDAPLPEALSPGAPLVLAPLDFPGRDRPEATLYVLKPDGFVTRSALSTTCAPDPVAAARAAATRGRVGADDPDCRPRVSVPTKAQGRYVAEVVVDDAAGPSDPEVALLWPFVVGKPKAPPFPEVLFPDKGHSDIALTHRAEALFQRLRNEELIEPFKVSPELVDVATRRAKAVAARGSLGHRVPLPGAGGAATDAAQDLAARYAGDPRVQFKKLAEVQAQASTLADAWQALLDSPAHRYVLVDTSFTHCGVAVARGVDAAGRATINLVALLARRPPKRDPEETRETILEAANDARDKRGLAALEDNIHLDKIATRLAGAMRDQKKVDETLLGGPVARVALEADASLARVKPLVARNNDPLLIMDNGVPPLLLDIDATKAGVGTAMDPDEGVFYVVVLAGE